MVQKAQKRDRKEMMKGNEQSRVFSLRTLKSFSKRYLEVTSELKTAIIGRSLFWTQKTAHTDLSVNVRGRKVIAGNGIQKKGSL